MTDMERSDCKICQQPNDGENTVRCNICRWDFHCGCVKVDVSVLNQPWICDRCQQSNPSNPSTTVVTTTQAGTTTTTANGSTNVLSSPAFVQNSVRAQACLSWLAEEQRLLEREIEMQLEHEMERKKIELAKMALKAKYAILGDHEGQQQTVISHEQLAVGNVEEWKKRMVNEMQNLSIVQPNTKADVTSSAIPVFGHSSTPTTSTVPDMSSFDLTMIGAPFIPSMTSSTLEPAPPMFNTTVSPTLSSIQAAIERYRLMGAVPKGLGSKVPMSSTLQGLTFSQMNNIPASAIHAHPQNVSSTPSNLNPPTTSVYSYPFLNSVGQQVGSTSGMAASLSSANLHQFPGVLGQNVQSTPSSFPPSNTYPYPGALGQQMPNAGGHIGPTSQQLLARQVMPKDLPPFRGDPEDWPLFYCAYINSTSACGYSDVENLARLQRALQGKAYEAVRSRLLLPAAVPQVISTLYMLFGRPELIIHTLLNKIRDVPAPKPDRLETLIAFGMAVQNFCDHLEAAGQVAHLCNPVLLQELVEKIPAQQRLDWALYKRQFPAVDLRTFSAYMFALVQAASDVTVISETKEQKPVNREKFKERNFLNAHSFGEPLKTELSTTQPEAYAVLCLVCNDPNHKVKDCEEFRKMESERRWKVVQEHHLCRTCLGKHGRRPCRSQNRCGVEDCQLRHHPMLHSAPNTQLLRDEPKHSNQASWAEGVNAHHSTKQSVLFRILPVRLHSMGKSVETFAFLDDGSSVTLVNQSLVEQLGINGGTIIPLCLSWTGNVTRYEAESKRVKLEICGFGMDQHFSLEDVRTVTSLNLPQQTLNFDELSKKFTHLQGLPISSYNAVSPGILIGSNNASITASLRIREGKLGDPIATRTRLGWSLFGSTVDSNDTANSSLHICECSRDRELHDIVKEYFTVESVGVSANKGSEAEEDKLARKIMERTTKRVSQGFETGLLWRYNQFEFPNSFPMAMRRLECFERRMKADTERKESVDRQIREYLNSGYIHLATQRELKSADPGRVWYLPLGAVRNPKKPGKIRLVWDAAAKVGGTSFNSMLLKGPDLLVSLTVVLCGFRERKVALCGDIKQMFHRFKIRSEDAQSQRFIYRQHPSHPVQVYVMDVGTFGSTCSPSQAQFIKNLNAMEHEKDFPQAAVAITKKHYVDDYLDSFDDKREAIQVALQVKAVHAKGGFEIRNWLSNSPAVLRRVGEPELQMAKAITTNKESITERVLGMQWLPREDWFSYSVAFNPCEIKPTKREILRCVMSLFDPLGLLSQFLVHGRILIQDIWRTRAEWDEEVTEEIQERWRKWIVLFNELQNIRIPRQYFPGFLSTEIQSLQLHVFVDASEHAYACAAYLRAEIQGQIYCTLVMAKAKVAPLKTLSIPRLELQAALIGARLAKTVCESHSLPIDQRFFWTDSGVTLAWLGSDQRRFLQFVEVRKGEILTITNVGDWRWVPTKHNVADEATKWGKGPCLDSNGRWFRGPDFLYQTEADWPKTVSKKPFDTTEELRVCFVHRELVPVEQLVDCSRFSKWERLLRAVAYVHRFISNCRRCCLRQLPELEWLTQPELEKSENSLWCMTQKAAYPDEVAVLQKGSIKGKKVIEKTSKVYKLSPFLDDHGVMRVDSRLGAAPYATFDFKFPVILPRHHRLTELLIDWYHREYLHGNRETVVNEVRQRFHVSNLRTVVRHVAENCQACKVAKAVPAVPRMAPLPEVRLTPFVRPFTFVGLDYFGHISVKIGRCVVKRWVALFTCLSVRAVHLEIVHSLSAESCKMAIRRFIARRGSPKIIHSNNGTNFQGASRELREQIQHIGKQLAETFTNANTQWVFTPPSAPHFGGVWERLVRSVKTALGHLTTLRNPDEETLQTIMAEAEAVVNSRPLTYVPLESSDQEALTPNHFILLSSSGVVQPARELVEPSTVSWTNWNLARQHVDQFWRRWIKEYLPTIAKRTKWFEETKAPEAGDLVIIVDESVRNGWIRGRVISLIPGRDGTVRQAMVQTENGTFRRPVVKLAVLEVQASSEAKPEADT